MKTDYIKEKKHIAKATLKKERGWTDFLIRHFLKAPDLTVDNPHYKCASPMSLYLIERVERIEATDGFKAMMQSASIRKKKVGKAVDTKRSRIMTYVESMRVDVPDIPKEELFKRAVASYNNFRSMKASRRDEWFEPATVDSDEHFLNRISKNYLRHQCTKYETELGRIFGKVGVDEAYMKLKEKINGAIDEKYPFLAQ